MPLLAATTDLFQVPPEQRNAALAMVWIGVGLAALVLAWPVARRMARQIGAVAVLGFREGLRLKMLWTVFVLSLIPGLLAYFSDADGTHAGRARLVLDTCLSTGEILGAGLIVLLSAFSIAREIESRIMHTLGTKPVPRWAILGGKALGFWAVDLLFLTCLVAVTGLLVRAVPLRAETRPAGELTHSGTWDDLRRNALTTRVYRDGDDGSKADVAFRFIKPGASHKWGFAVSADDLTTEQLALRFRISSDASFAAHIKDVTITAANSGQPPLLAKTLNIPQDRAFDLFIDSRGLTPGLLEVTIAASQEGAYPPKLLVQRAAGLRLGVVADGFSGNLLKSMLLMAVQGWILALICTGWSGVLSFPVTVAIGMILILGGEMSREAAELLSAETSRVQAMGMDVSQQVLEMQRVVIERVRFLLELLPDFRAAGGPAAFVEGTFLSGWALAHAALWMGIVRGLGWALPGVLLFQRREVGK